MFQYWLGIMTEKNEFKVGNPPSKLYVLMFTE